MESIQMSIKRWINKDVVYNGLLLSYSAIKRNKIVPFAETSMDLETTIIQSEVSQKEK